MRVSSRTRRSDSGVPSSPRPRRRRYVRLHRRRPDDLAITVDAHAIDDGFAIAGFLRFGLLVPGRMKPRSMRASVRRQHDKDATARDLGSGIVKA